MNDIAPELLESIQKRFREKAKENSTLYDIGKRAADGKITYEDANKAAQEIGKTLSETYQERLSSEILPDGKMYYNIADRVIGHTMTEAHGYISDFAENAQKAANEEAGVGLKPVRPEINQDKIDGIINRVSNADNYDDIAWILDAPVRTFCQSIIDDFVRENAEFQGKSGLKPKIIRKTSGKCCKWCSRLAGTYSYPDVPKDVYRRHNNCNCTVEYDPGSGKKYRDVWSKTWRYQKDNERINELKKLNGITKSNMISDNVEDVSLEYFKKSNPGKGKVIQHSGFDVFHATPKPLSPYANKSRFFKETMNILVRKSRAIAPHCGLFEFDAIGLQTFRLLDIELFLDSFFYRRARGISDFEQSFVGWSRVAVGINPGRKLRAWGEILRHKLRLSIHRFDHGFNKGNFFFIQAVFGVEFSIRPRLGEVLNRNKSKAAPRNML